MLDFLEDLLGELRRITLPRTPVNKALAPDLRADSSASHPDVRTRRTTPSEKSSTLRTIWMVS
jgi:hypothetical protein